MSNWHKNEEGNNVSVTVTERDLARAFTEWDRRYREDPDAFESELSCILRGKTVEDYGDAAAPYLIEMLAMIDSADVDAALGL